MSQPTASSSSTRISQVIATSGSLATPKPATPLGSSGITPLTAPSDSALATRAPSDASAAVSSNWSQPNDAMSASTSTAQSTSAAVETTVQRIGGSRRGKTRTRGTRKNKKRKKQNVFTLKQIKEHNTAASCWLHAHGKVYDVTDFVAQHPGGQFAILRHAGKNADRDFDFHSRSARKLWDTLRIGKVHQPHNDESSCTIL